MQNKIKKICAIVLALVMICSNVVDTSLLVKAEVKITSFTLSSKSKQLYVGEKTTLKVKKVKPAKASSKVIWRSSNKKIATVTSKGCVTAKAVGTVKITATSKSNKKVKAVCKIKVIAKPSKIALNYDKKTLEIGESFTLKVKSIKPKKAQKKVTYTSSKNSVVTVNQKGKVTAKGVGNAVITVRSAVNKKVKATCKVTVKRKEPEITKTPTVTKRLEITEVPTVTKEPGIITPTEVPTITETLEVTKNPEISGKPEITETPTVTKGLEVTKGVEITKVPTITKGLEPTKVPTVTKGLEPTKVPTVTKGLEPTKVPTVTKGVEPTKVPTVTKGLEPTKVPTVTKGLEPTKVPTVTKGLEPTKVPTVTKGLEPTKVPTVTKSLEITEIPTITKEPETTKRPTVTKSVEITKVPTVTKGLEITEFPKITNTVVPTAGFLPTNTPVPTNTPMPTNTPVPTLPLVGELRDVGENETYLDITGPRKDSVGTTVYDCIYFGNYPQSDSTGETTDSIKWRVLSVNGTEAFLMADSVLDYINFYDESKWGNSMMRSWLNGYDGTENTQGYDYSKRNFIDKAFTVEEQNAILHSTIKEEETKGYETEDKIYLLSLEQITNPEYGFYWDRFVNDNCRSRYWSKYAYKKHYSYDYEGAIGEYLLIDNRVVSAGKADNLFSSSSGICPVLHLDLTKEEVWEKAGEVRIEKTEAESDLDEVIVMEPGETKKFSLEGREIATYRVYEYITSYTYGLGNGSGIHPFSEAESFSIEKTGEDTIELTIPETYTGSGLERQLELTIKDWNETEYFYNITIWIKNDNFAYNVCDGKAIIMEYVGEDKERVKELTIPGTLGEYEVTKVNSGFLKCRDLTGIKVMEGIQEVCLETLYGEAKRNFKKLYVPTTIKKVNGTIKEVEFADGTTEIPAEVCKEIKGLSKVTIPKTVTCIKDSAFENQKSLLVEELPENVMSYGERAFYNCNVVAETLPDNMQEVGAKAFYGCNITAKKLPDNIQTIGEAAFSGCALSIEKLPELLVTIGKNAFAGSTLPDTLIVPPSLETGIGLNGVKKLILEDGRTELNAKLLDGITSIEELILPGTLTKISGSCVFKDCKNVKELFLPKTIESVACTYDDEVGWRDGAFSKCPISKIIFEEGWQVIPSYMFYSGSEKVEEIVLPDSVTHINGRAFYGVGIKNLKLPANIQYLGGYAFYSCKNLEKVTVPAGVNIDTTINAPFSGCSIKTAVIEDGVTTIPGYLFSDAGVEELILPDSVTSIGSFAFNRTEITSLKFPANVEKIGTYAFAQCNNLEKVIIPATVEMEKVGFASFSGSSKVCVEFQTGTTKIPAGLFESGDIQEVIIPDTVTEIGARAFFGCENLKKVHLPEGLEAIGQLAFRDCKALEEITIPSTVKKVGGGLGPSFERSGIKKVIFAEGVTGVASNMFINADQLTEVVFSDTVTTIGDRAFYGCESLTAINLPENLTGIGCRAFSDCISLTEVTIPSTVNYMGNGIDGSAFENSGITKVTLEEGMLVIPSYAFSGCETLDTVALPSTVEEIESYVFYGCKSLATIQLPEGIKKLGSYTFGNTTALKEITLPKTLIEYGSPLIGCSFEGSGLETAVLEEGTQQVYEGLFVDCENLTSVKLPSTITSIGSRAFAYCKSMTEFTIPPTVVSLGEAVFMDSSISKISVPSSVTSCGSMAWSAFDGENIKEVTLEEGFTEIYDQMFGGCSGLTKVNCPSTLKRIGSNAFTCCSSLESFVVPDGVTSIADLAFGECFALKSVTIPKSVTSIGNIFWRVTDAEAAYPTIITKQGSVADTFAQSKGYTVMYME